ncbi:hypothetical protein [Acidisphaera sp. L21]|uniref:hypothetical protein n=1 Tax=Acidisphaera sp. L21 TaxID=1641851 RepID=UPI001574FE7F|nr:hypothetical protein [Acidisphaera sp. L21]
MKCVGQLFGIVFTVGTLAAAILGAVFASQRLDHRPRLDDAFIDADVVYMAPDVSGRLMSLEVTNNKTFRAGELAVRDRSGALPLAARTGPAQLSGLQATPTGVAAAVPRRGDIGRPSASHGATT